MGTQRIHLHRQSESSAKRREKTNRHEETKGGFGGDAVADLGHQEPLAELQLESLNLHMIRNL